MLSREIIEDLNDQKYNWQNSCRSEAISVNLIVEKTVALMDKAEEKVREIEKYVQQKRGPPHRQLMLCSNKRPKIE